MAPPPGKAPPSFVQTSASSGGVTTLTESMTVGGLKRSYLLVRPTKVPAGRRLPVVMILHGINVTPQIEERRTGFLPLATSQAAILVYPAGYKEAWNAGACCSNPGTPANIDDVAFITDVVYDVLATQPANPAQVYLAGYSDGGKMTYRVACADPSLFAGFGAAEAVATSTCKAHEPESFVEVISSGDPEIAYDPSDPAKRLNGFTELSATAQIDQFVSLDRCSSNPTSAVAGKMTTLEWRQCADARRVELATLAGGSHAWPDGANGSPSAEAVIWTFWTGRAFP